MKMIISFNINRVHIKYSNKSFLFVRKTTKWMIPFYIPFFCSFVPCYYCYYSQNKNKQTYIYIQKVKRRYGNKIVFFLNKIEERNNIFMLSCLCYTLFLSPFLIFLDGKRNKLRRSPQADLDFIIFLKDLYECWLLKRTEIHTICE